MRSNRVYAVAAIQDGRVARILSARLSIHEAAAWLESHHRAPVPDEQPCILRYPISRATCLARSKSRSA